MKSSKQYTIYSRQIWLFIVFPIAIGSLLSTAYCSAHQNKTDSLLSLLKKDKEDTNKILHLNALAWELKSNNPDTSILLSNQALTLAEKHTWKKGIANSFGQLGVYNYHKGDYPDALDYYFKALKLREELGDKKTTATLLGNVGNVYCAQSDYPKALDYYFKALKMAEDLGDKRGIAMHLGNIGIVYDAQKNYPKAIDYYFKTLKIAEELGLKDIIASSCGNIGIMYMEQTNYTQAEYYSFKALKLAEELHAKSLIASCLGNIGSLYTYTKKYAESEKYLLNALTLSREIGAVDYEREFEENLSDLYSKTNRFQLALEHYKKATELKDTLFSTDKNKEITRKEMNYEFEKKEAAQKAEQEKQTAVAEADKKKQHVILYLVIGGLLMVLLFAGFISRALRITRRQKKLIEKQKQLVEEKQKEILDSIHYARRIQTALLPTEKYIDKTLKRLMKNNMETKNFFILYKPKDIVSGDFYYALAHKTTTSKNELFYLGTADCTGHGVPGAFMSMLGVSSLTEAIIEKNITLPNEILNDLRNSIIASLNPEGSEEEAQDGMDCVLCAYDFENMLLHVAAANNPLWIVRDGEVKEYQPDKMPVGKYGDDMKSFSLQTINLQKGDLVYTFTDGYADQFGGHKGKKFKYKQLETKLLEHHHLPMEAQKKALDEIFDNWKGNMEQVDDVLVIGIKI